MTSRGVARSRVSVRRALLLAAAVALVTAVLAVWHASRSRGGEVSRCQSFREASIERAEAATGHGERVVVIGDSWSAGLHLARPAQSWASRLPGRVHVAGFSGSGFSEGASVCGQVSFADRAPAALRDGADLVVVEGGLNDYDQPDAAIRAGFARLMRILRPYRAVGHVVVVGPALAPARAAQVPRVDALLRSLASAYDVRYVATRTWTLPYLPDRLHLTVAGHREFGDLVAARLAD